MTKDRIRMFIRIVVLLLAVTLIATGIVSGGMRNVFIKAANICSECIGLG